jgi:drug/metabolite transporter (DMT)-like permease
MGCIAMSTNFWAVHALALVQHTVIHLTQPVFVAFASPWLLHERTPRSAIAALMLALVGASIVLLPAGPPTWSTLALAVSMPLLPGAAGLLSASSSALAHIMLRLATAPELRSRLDPDAPADAPATVVFHFTATVTVLGTIVGLLVGDFRSMPADLTAADSALRIAAMAGTGLLGQLAMSSAYSRGEAPAIAIVAYAAIPISACLDAFAWGAPLGFSTAVGAALMVLAGGILSRARSWPQRTGVATLVARNAAPGHAAVSTSPHRREITSPARGHGVAHGRPGPRSPHARIDRRPDRPLLHRLQRHRRARGDRRRRPRPRHGQGRRDRPRRGPRRARPRRAP